MSGKRASVLLLLVMLPGLGCGGGGQPAGPTGPDQPVPVSPVAGAVVDTTTPTLVVRNARGFDAGQATYDFVVLSATGQTVEELTGVPAGTGETRASLTRPLLRGAGYQWKAVARGTGRSVESSAASFEVGIPCDAGSDAYAKSVVDFWVSSCTQRTNRALFLDPRSVLGPPDARGDNQNGRENYSGILSLGEKGYVVVDMGVCIRDAAGADLRIFQYVESEPVTVLVSGSPTGPWSSLGTKSCGDGGLPVNSNHCDFDLAQGGLKAARYVWVEDAENFPCQEAGTRSEGADIDAVEALNLRK